MLRSAGVLATFTFRTTSALLARHATGSMATRLLGGVSDPHTVLSKLPLHLTQSGYALLASAARSTGAAACPGCRYDCLLVTVSPIALDQAHRAMYRKHAIDIPRNSARCSTMTTIAALEYNLRDVECS
jgi:hypothetical protein